MTENVERTSGPGQSTQTQPYDRAVLLVGPEDVERVRCVNCSGRYCGHRSVRVADGKPFAACALRLSGVVL